MVEREPTLRQRLLAVIVGGPSGSAAAAPDYLHALARRLDVHDLVRFEPPATADRLADFYRAAAVTVVPSYSESFGLVALESQACGTPVVAARVGGLATAVADGVSGVLVDGHQPQSYADVLTKLISDDALRGEFSTAAVEHAAGFGWDRTVEGVLGVYGDAIAVSERRALELSRMSAAAGRSG
jgi:D-inositol-3-phosphate glycosyltransferase